MKNSQFATILLITSTLHNLIGCNLGVEVDEYGTELNKNGEPVLGCNVGEEIPDIRDAMADSGLGVGARLVKYHGFRNGGSSGQECYYSGATAHNCYVPGYIENKYVWAPVPGFVDTNELYQIRVGLLNAMGYINGYGAPNNRYFWHTGSGPTMNIGYSAGPACSPGAGNCSFASAGMNGTKNPIQNSNLPEPVDYVYESTSAGAGFNLTRVLNWAKSCYGSANPPDLFLVQAGEAAGTHEFMHAIGFVHTIADTIMYPEIACSKIGQASGQPTNNQIQAMMQFRPGDWSNATLITNITTER